MSSSIYEEALADVKKLKEVAEQNAKNAIIDAVTPKIREMIEKQLLGEEVDDDGDVLSDLAESLLDEDADDVRLTSESLKALSGLVNGESSFSAKDTELRSLLVQERLLIIMDEAADTDPDIDSLVEMKAEIISTHRQLVENRADVTDTDFNRIQKRLASLDHFLNEAIGENEMNERNLRSILDEEALRLVLDLGDEVEVGPDGVVNPDNVEVSVETVAAEEEDAEEEDAEVDAETEELSDLVDDEEMPQPSAEDAIAESDEVLEINEDQLANMIRSILNEDDDADEDLDEDVLVDGGKEQVDPAGVTTPGDEDEPADEGVSDETVVEISESMLRRELGRMRSIREASTPATTTTSDKDYQVALHEVGQLKTQLQEYKKAVSSLRGQLDESNLFNAKLLYANKLLQNRDLSDKQRVNIVESLDSAKSLREVRLLYKSLIDSTTSRSNLTESKRRRAAGSASRPTRTGSVSKESFPETDRWALLAGINK
jgi:hypothetical protein